jgi:acyl-CoA thioesterase-1
MNRPNAVRSARGVRQAAAFALLVAAWAAACGKGDPNGASGGAPAGAPPVQSTTADTVAATAPGSAGAAIGTPSAPGAPRALFIGTSLTAGLGLADPAHESWPAVIYHIADSTGYPLTVVNAGLSGETSAGALRRADWLLREPYDLIIIETGANDGLRGVDPASTAKNIRGIIAKARAASPGAEILLVQMEAPTNMGPRYTKEFHDLFPTVARSTGVTLLPFLLEGVGGVARLNQADGIHPTADGARIAARNVWPGIRMVLRQRRVVSERRSTK